MKVQLGACALLVCVSACHGNYGNGVQGDGVAKTEARSLGAFETIDVDGAMKVELSTGPLAVSLSGDENLLPLITTTVTGGKLVVNETKEVRTKVPLVLTIHAPNVSRIETDGAADVQATGIRVPTFSVVADGAADVMLSGQVDRLDIELGGAGSVRAAGLVAKEARIGVSGAGSVEVNASQKLKADVSGVGSVRYSGAPTVEKNVSGVGSVTPVT